MTPHDLARLTQIARQAAEAAGVIHLQHFRSPGLKVEHKADRTPVTVADRDSEQAIRDVLRKLAPGLAIKGEEFGLEAGTDGQTSDLWLIDPIDGTKNFVTGLPIFASLIGLVLDGRVAVGVVHAPALGRNGLPVGDTWWAHRGGGAWLNNERIHVSTVSDLASAALGVGGLKHMSDATRWALVHRLVQRTARTRGFGDWYGHVLVADGRMDIMVDPIVADYDLGPLPVLLEEAGGRFSAISGELRLDGGNALSTNGALHDEVVAMLQGWNTPAA
ncbi:MAG: inositol monophosphatase [Planctomycetota bacterium]